METSQVVGRSFYAAFARLTVCDCATTTRSSRIAPSPRHLRRAHQATSTSRAFATQSARRAEAPVSPSSNAAPASSPASSKERLRTYTRSMHKIITGLDLRSKIPSADHENLLKATITAETKLDAPGQSASAFDPALYFLKQQVEPILQKHLQSTDVSKLAAQAAQQPKETPVLTQSAVSSIGTPSTANISRPRPRETPVSDIAAQMRDIFRPPPKTGRTALGEASPSKSRDSDFISEILSSRGGSRMTDRDRLLSMDVQNKIDKRESEYLKANKAANRPSLRLKPTLGRTVEVGAGYDVTRAFRTMESLCARNGVRKDMQSQRFHIRRGQLKKNMRIIRWRKLFKEGFLKECERVRRMRRQGW